jgi:hypothetical protein
MTQVICLGLGTQEKFKGVGFRLCSRKKNKTSSFFDDVASPGQ